MDPRLSKLEPVRRLPRPTEDWGLSMTLCIAAIYRATDNKQLTTKL
jgi:hypothetical protein